MSEPDNGNGARPVLHDYRCNVCGRLLFRGYLAPGSEVDIRCWHQSCKGDNHFPRVSRYKQVGNVFSPVETVV